MGLALTREESISLGITRFSDFLLEVSNFSSSRSWVNLSSGGMDCVFLCGIDGLDEEIKFCWKLLESEIVMD